MQWAHVMVSDAARREAMGPNEAIHSSLKEKGMGRYEAIGSSLKDNGMGPYETIGNCCSRCSGPMLGHRKQLAEKQWAQTKPSAAA